jgi:hypothetical protein
MRCTSTADGLFIYKCTKLFFTVEFCQRQDKAELRVLYQRCARPARSLLLRDFVEAIEDLCNQLPAAQQICGVDIGEDEWICGGRGDLLVLNGRHEEIAAKLSWLKEIAEVMAQLWEEGWG